MVEGDNSAVDGAHVAIVQNTALDVKNAAEGNLNASGDIYVHYFQKPFEYEGKKYKTLNFHFGELTGRDVLTIETEMQANNEYALDPLLSRNFQSKMAAKAGNIGTDVLEAMPIRDFNNITNAARNFLVSSDS